MEKYKYRVIGASFDINMKYKIGSSPKKQNIKYLQKLGDCHMLWSVPPVQQFDSEGSVAVIYGASLIQVQKKKK